MSLADYINKKGVVPVSFHKPKKKGKIENTYPGPFHPGWDEIQAGKPATVTFADGSQHEVMLTDLQWNMGVADAVCLDFQGVDEKTGQPVSGHGDPITGLKAGLSSHVFPYDVLKDATISGFKTFVSNNTGPLWPPKPQAAQPQADLSQIEADLEKLPETKEDPYPAHDYKFLSSGLISSSTAKSIYDLYKVPSLFYGELGTQPPKDPETELKNKLTAMAKEVAYGLESGVYALSNGDSLTFHVDIAVPSKLELTPTEDPINANLTIKKKTVKITLEVQK